MTAKKKAKEFQADLTESAHKIWLAGLGALVAAEEEGSKLFKSLVARGETIEARGKKQVKKAKSTMGSTMGEVKSAAEGYWGTLEQTLDEKVTSVIHRLGVPTKDEITALTAKVEELTKSIERMRPAKPAAKPSTPAKPRTAAKPKTPATK
jgi:poly(hydroxyalkanoate) granule-associated protein